MSRKMNLFKEVPGPRVPRNLFDLSHDVKMSGKFGFLYPVLLVDTLPGETWREQMIAMVRFAPMLFPIYHKVIVKTDFFFVPDRLTVGQELWEKFITGGQDGTLSPVLPFTTPDGVATNFDPGAMEKGSLWDYMGLPIFEGGGAPPGGWNNSTHISLRPFKAYVKIWNDYFRDPNLDTEVALALNIEGNQSALTPQWLAMRRRGWDRDLFTGALPWAQRGAEVLMPLSGTASVTYLDKTFLVGGVAVTEGNAQVDADTSATIKQLTDPVGVPLSTQNIDEITIDGANTTINDFRTTLAIQKWLENNARGGGRYIEQMVSHYGERVPDYRLQRAEYLGGGRQVVRISEVLATAESAEIPVGDMAGHGISVGKSNRFTYRCQEHGLILGIMSIVPVPSYASQGIEKLWTKENKYDIGFPEFANLGEQAILSQELFYSMDLADTADNLEVFGYVPRYAEYKFKQDRLAGDFRDTLAFTHLSRIFLERPALDSPFLQVIEDDGVTPAEESMRRIFAVQDGTDYLWMQLFHNLTAKRPLPYFGVPELKG